MSVEQIDKIDFVGLDKDSDSVILTISDHLSWKDSERHLFLLQEKLNYYLSFIEEGELAALSSKYCGKNIIIEIVGAEPMNEEGLTFLDQAKKVLELVGFNLKFSLIN